MLFKDETAHVMLNQHKLCVSFSHVSKHERGFETTDVREEEKIPTSVWLPWGTIFLLAVELQIEKEKRTLCIDHRILYTASLLIVFYWDIGKFQAEESRAC